MIMGQRMCLTKVMVTKSEPTAESNFVFWPAWGRKLPC